MAGLRFQSEIFTGFHGEFLAVIAGYFERVELIKVPDGWCIWVLRLKARGNAGD